MNERKPLTRGTEVFEGFPDSADVAESSGHALLQEPNAVARPDDLADGPAAESRALIVGSRSAAAAAAATATAKFG